MQNRNNGFRGNGGQKQGSRRSGSGFGKSQGRHSSFGNGNNNGNGFSRPKFSGGGSNRNGNKFGSRFGGNRFGKKGGRGRKTIDVTKFINKVEKIEEEVKYVNKHTFNDFKIEEKLKKAIENRKFLHPTPIQDSIIPFILEGKDVVGMANTGTGKTAAFLIPLIDKMIKNPKEKALVIVPTRELATQINDELHAFVRGMGIFSVVCVGGSNLFRQIQELKRFQNFVIGTPGRLKDLIERKQIILSEFRNIVLDEADRMLDMGFINDMRFVVSQMPKEKQGMFFSATMSPEIESLIKNFLKDPVTISVKTRETSKNIEQDIIRVSRENRLEKLCELLTSPEFSKVLVFGQMKHSVERLSRDLQHRGFKADSIHGNKPQNRRQKTLGRFKTDDLQILVATDVAARGLDIPDVSHVINYDIPESHEDYVHRIGRTGRGDKKGKALTFVSE